MSIKFFFGANLKMYRKKKQLSQEELSEKVDISSKHLSAIERGLTFVSAELLEKLAVTLEIPVFRFFVKDTEIFYGYSTLDTVDRIIEQRLDAAIKDIKLDIRQNKNMTGAVITGTDITKKVMKKWL